MIKIYLLKVICLSPKGKVEDCKKVFEKWLSLTNKPIETKIINENSFYFIYEFKNEQQKFDFMNNRIPKAVKRIRDTYWLIIHIVDRANKIKDKLNWAVDKGLRWARRMLKAKAKELKDEEINDFIKDIDLKDKDEFIKFLKGDIISSEEITEAIKC